GGGAPDRPAAPAPTAVPGLVGTAVSAPVPVLIAGLAPIAVLAPAPVLSLTAVSAPVAVPGGSGAAPVLTGGAARNGAGPSPGAKRALPVPTGNCAVPVPQPNGAEGGQAARPSGPWSAGKLTGLGPSRDARRPAPAGGLRGPRRAGEPARAVH